MVWVIRVINMVITLLSNQKKIALSHLLSMLILVIAFPLFFLGGPTPGSSKLFCALWDSGHIIFFVALMYALSKRFDLNNLGICLAIFAAVFLGGGLIELIQAHIGRDGNWQDLFNDLTGTCVGLFWLQRARPWIWVGRILSLVLLLPLLSSIMFELAIRLEAKNQFPLLAGFESPLSVYSYKNVTRSSVFHSQGLYSAEIKLTPGGYSGISFSRLVRDWRNYKQLSVDIYNPDPQALRITLRVNDVLHDTNGWVDSDRFNQVIDLVPGLNHLVFSMEAIQHGPATRTMDLSQVSEVIISTRQIPQTRVIYLDNLRLE
jgi:hypothetical protein